MIDEAVIRRHVGIGTDPAIMPNQLRHLADKSAEEFITIRVIPFSAGAHAGLSGAFTLLEFDGELPDLLYLDPGRGERAVLSVDSPRVTEYADNFESLLGIALTESESTAFILRAAEAMSLWREDFKCSISQHLAPLLFGAKASIAPTRGIALKSLRVQEPCIYVIHLTNLAFPLRFLPRSGIICWDACASKGRS